MIDAPATKQDWNAVKKVGKIERAEQTEQTEKNNDEGKTCACEEMQNPVVSQGLSLEPCRTDGKLTHEYHSYPQVIHMLHSFRRLPVWSSLWLVAKECRVYVHKVAASEEVTIPADSH